MQLEGHARVEAAIRDALARPSDAALIALHIPAPLVGGRAFVRAVSNVLAQNGAHAAARASASSSVPLETAASTSFVFEAPDGPALAGVGAASMVAPARTAADARGLLASSSVEVRSLSLSRGAPLRACVALPFPDEREGPEGLARGIAFVPRWMLASEAGVATATFCAPPSACTGREAVRVAEEWSAIERALSERGVPERGVSERAGAVEVPVPRLEDGTTREAYVQGVEEARSELARGELRKVVLSRRLVWRADRAFDPLALLARLSVESGLGAHVAVQHAGEAFVATTPERLVRRRGARVETEALAGTVDLRDTDPGALGASAKDLEEHAWVVRAIREALEPLCASLEAPAVPGLRALRQVAHLHTPIGALLREPAHVLELAARLHPTPAVGGYPTEPALRWIRAHEREPRGLYAGLVGYFDHEGDGDLWVGLRGAMVRGCELEQRVGAGLVEASCGEDEWLETEAKRRALARSLGAAP